MSLPENVGIAKKMEQRTDDEIRAKVQELWPEFDLSESAYGRNYFEIRREVNHIDLVITAMYDAPDLSLKQTQGLAEFFKAKNVYIAEDIDNEGCETCGYGGQFGVMLRISSGNPVDSMQTG